MKPVLEMKGKNFHIYSDNANIKAALDELFYDILNVDFNLRVWFRNLVKYGDLFLYNEVAPGVGVVNVQAINVNEVEREEGGGNQSRDLGGRGVRGVEDLAQVLRLPEKIQPPRGESECTDEGGAQGGREFQGQLQ